MESKPKCLQRQTLPVIPRQKSTCSVWNDLLLLVFGLALGFVIGFAHTAKANQQTHETLTEQDRGELTALVANLNEVK